MITIITGASHTGKTLLATEIVRRTGALALSIDLLKMGLIRSGQTSLTPYDDDELTDFLWPLVSEMARTAIENQQDLVIEGCYIPGNWRNTFTNEELDEMEAYCLIMDDGYIVEHFDEIATNANVAERRLDDSGLSAGDLMKDNARYRSLCDAGCFTAVPIAFPYDVGQILDKIDL